ncbi:TraR/DksA family transcriptional regulator [Aliikangiella coralliicola]|uniref:TraR/DksA family transcriptional regulator n=1 Tax=Aliikangiella coralliicola TaxID=2592383 RepID=UPI00143D041A|nr:TraR/DksA family transcriptional regulator [Aliikangiella coralliicola]
MSKKEKQKLKLSIKEQIITLQNQLSMAKESSKTVELDQSLAGRVSRIDAIQQQKMAQAGLNRTQQRINVLNKTIEQIDNEDFGYCEECGDEIGFSRLQIKPESTNCVACQQSKE